MGIVDGVVYRRGLKVAMAWLRLLLCAYEGVAFELTCFHAKSLKHMFPLEHLLSL